MCVTCGLCAVVRVVWVVWVVWGREIREDREIREKVATKASIFRRRQHPSPPFAKGDLGGMWMWLGPQASIFCKKNRGHRKVRHVNLKLVSS